MDANAATSTGSSAVGPALVLALLIPCMEPALGVCLVSLLLPEVDNLHWLSTRQTQRASRSDKVTESFGCAERSACFHSDNQIMIDHVSETRN